MTSSGKPAKTKEKIVSGLARSIASLVKPSTRSWLNVARRLIPVDSAAGRCVVTTFPTRKEDLTSDWLDRVLHDAGVLHSGTLRGIEVERIGEGVGILGCWPG